MPVRGLAIGFCIDCDGHMRISTPEQNRAAAVEARNPLQWIFAATGSAICERIGVGGGAHCRFFERVEIPV